MAAVKGVSFDVNEGEALGILGESGAGKSTLVGSILRLLSPDEAVVEGSVCFRGINMLRTNEATLRQVRGAMISLISQEPELGLNPFIRIRDQVAEVLRSHTDLNKQERRRRAGLMLDAVGLTPEMYSSYPHQLSGGQRQRAVIAQALVCTPALLAADEPTSGLDNVTQAEILRLLKQLKQSFKLAVLFITHDPSLLSGLADHILVMREGRVIETGTLHQICTAPQHSYTAGLLRFASLPPLAAAQ